MKFDIELDEIFKKSIAAVMLENQDDPQACLNIVLGALGAAYAYTFLAIKGIDLEGKLSLWEINNKHVINCLKSADVEESKIEH